MPSLPNELFSLLETKTLQARETAEKAARNITAYLKVENSAWWGGKDDPQRIQWLGLRARARQLGYTVEDDSEKDPVKRGMLLLVEEIAYEQWHRMLFARFLAENHLLMHPSGVAVSLAECEELAPEEGEDDAWRLAARYAGAMLPGIFKQEDPCAQVRLTPSDHHALESILQEIPPLVFTCDDALGWMYQFWQSKKKDEVNKSERKIGGADISPVTQLFTEDYMVRFLLENSLGAWWAARHPDSPLVKEWDYLRYQDDGTPAAGRFPGWPERAAEVTVMDPCCGSGHFLVAAFDMLRRMRMEEEGLDAREAASRTLQENIFGLEIDQRCTQIAWFALSLVGWKSGGYQTLPELNIACTGIPVKGQMEDWLTMAGDDSRVKAGLERLYNLFKDAPDLGSLINPADVPLVDRMFVADYEQIIPILKQLLETEQNNKDYKANLLGYSPSSVLSSAKLLSRRYILIITNVPYLGEKKQSKTLMNYCTEYYPASKADLATTFIERCVDFSEQNGTLSIVSPQNWMSHKASKQLRLKLLKKLSWNEIARLGTNAFSTISGEIVNVALLIVSKPSPVKNRKICNINVTKNKCIKEKQRALLHNPIITVLQEAQLNNPDYRILDIEILSTTLLSHYATGYSGINTGEKERFNRHFWEINTKNTEWEFLQDTTDTESPFGGCTDVIFWQNGNGELYKLAQSLKHRNHVVQNWRRGQQAWGKVGLAINITGNLRIALYSGGKFYCTITVLIPKKKEYLSALWNFCTSEKFKDLIKTIDPKLAITTANFTKIPFDFNYWNSMPVRVPLQENFTNDPVIWLFDGILAFSSSPLQVACSRLLSYSWPNQANDNLSGIIDEDGIVCLAATHGESPAAERLRALLAAAYGSGWSGTKQEQILAAVGYSGKDLADWLRDGFFEQHCKLFHNRPFIWHIWDGRKDGFSALVNYHKLDRANLEKLTYTYLGAWITDRKKELERGAAGAEGRLLAAQALQEKLKLILAGEPPYDIFVRWKPLHEQPIGWEPDLNDGVRLNIRPFVTAGVLRSRFTINWNKDRGKNPDGSERLNDLHFTVAEKQAAREKQRK